MNDSLSIDEIIKQAEEIREKTVKKAQSALEDVNNSAKEITEREIEVPKPEPENIKIASKSPWASCSGSAHPETPASRPCPSCRTG